MYAYIAASLLQRWYTSEEHTKKLQNIEKERQWHIRRCVRCVTVFFAHVSCCTEKKGVLCRLLPGSDHLSQGG